MRTVITRVLPVPAPARTSTGPSVVVTARRCSGLRPARGFASIWARSTQAYAGAKRIQECAAMLCACSGERFSSSSSNTVTKTTTPPRTVGSPVDRCPGGTTIQPGARPPIVGEPAIGQAQVNRAPRLSLRGVTRTVVPPHLDAAVEKSLLELRVVGRGRRFRSGGPDQMPAARSSDPLGRRVRRIHAACSARASARAGFAPGRRHARPRSPGRSMSKSASRGTRCAAGAAPRRPRSPRRPAASGSSR